MEILFFFQKFLWKLTLEGNRNVGIFADRNWSETETCDDSSAFSPFLWGSGTGNAYHTWWNSYTWHLRVAFAFIVLKWLIRAVSSNAFCEIKWNQILDVSHAGTSLFHDCLFVYFEAVFESQHLSKFPPTRLPQNKHAFIWRCEDRLCLSYFIISFRKVDFYPSYPYCISCLCGCLRFLNPTSFLKLKL